MLLKTLLTLSLLLLSSCKSFTSAPSWPGTVKAHFYLTFTQDITTKEIIPHCYSFLILDTYPYTLEEPIEINPLACEGLSGYLPKEMKLMTNYADQVNEWAVKHCK